MKTTDYNPSTLEVEFANILNGMKDELNKRLINRKIQRSGINLELDNPIINLEILDDDGDRHTLILKLIQRPDKEESE